MIGTNNIGTNTPEQIADGIAAIVAKLRAATPETKVLVLGIFPRGPDANDEARKTANATNALVAGLADGTMVRYLDIGPKFLAEDGTLSTDIMPDLVHLSPAGYQIWADAIEAQVAELSGLHEAVIPITRDGEKLTRHERFNARVQQGNVDLVFIGDSITEGWEGAGAEAWQNHYGGRNAVNLGIGGDRTQHVLWRLDHGNIDGISPKLAVLMIGTNNSGTNSPEQIADGIKAIVARLRARLPETRVLVLGVFPRGADPSDARRQVNERTNQLIAGLGGGYRVHYLDIGPKFLAADGALSTDIMPDLLHLSPAGYQIWAEAIEEKVRELMGE
jgi:beta-glucosidase